MEKFGSIFIHFILRPDPPASLDYNLPMITNKHSWSLGAGSIPNKNPDLLGISIPTHPSSGPTFLSAYCTCGLRLRARTHSFRSNPLPRSHPRPVIAPSGDTHPGSQTQITLLNMLSTNEITSNRSIFSERSINVFHRDRVFSEGKNGRRCFANAIGFTDAMKALPISMQMNGRRKARGFLLIELLAVAAVLLLLVGVWGSALGRARERVWTVIDLSNMRHILQASAIYNEDNDGRMAHPTWGGDLSGPDGWAYLTSTKSRPVPGATMNFPGSCAGVDVNSARFTNQVAFFKVGQVTQYLPDVKTAWCPKDVALRSKDGPRGFPGFKERWIGRPVKVTSYCWNGTIGGYLGRRTIPSGSTYKVSQFLPGDWQTWEQNEKDSFWFNDAGNNPEDTLSGMSQRHSGASNWLREITSRRNLPGSGLVGTFGGSAQFVGWGKVWDLMNKRVRAPNAILNGPGYQP